MAGSEEESSFWGCLALLSLGAAAWLLWNQGPIAWYLAATLAAYAALTPPVARMKAREDSSRPLTAKIFAAFVEDSRKFFRNLAIGFVFILLVQLWFEFFEPAVDPNLIGTREQKLWDWLTQMKAAGSLAAAAAIVAGALFLSALVGNLIPLVLAGKLRKAVSTVAAVGTAALMFSFVTAGAAGSELAEATAPVRAQLAERLAKAAGDRRDAMAYRWVGAALEEIERTPLEAGPMRRYFSEGDRRCDRFQAAWESVSVPDPIGVGPARRIFAPGRLCDKEKLLDAMAIRLAGTDDPSRPPPDSLPIPDDFLYGDAPDRPIERSWLADFDDSVVRSAAPHAYEDAVLEVRPMRLRDLRAFAARVVETGKQAEDARRQMRGLATKAMGSLIGEAFAFEGAAGKAVELLRDAALGELAKRGEAGIKGLLTRAAAAGGSSTFSGRLLRLTFPDEPLPLRQPAGEQGAREEAEAAWASLHPQERTLDAVRVSAAAAAVAAVRERWSRPPVPTYPQPPSSGRYVPPRSYPRPGGRR